VRRRFQKAASDSGAKLVEARGGKSRAEIPESRNPDFIIVWH
jgi:hypothetical protein